MIHAYEALFSFSVTQLELIINLGQSQKVKSSQSFWFREKSL